MLYKIATTFYKAPTKETLNIGFINIANVNQIIHQVLFFYIDWILCNAQTEVDLFCVIWMVEYAT
jgi:hypothetical protein